MAEEIAMPNNLIYTTNIKVRDMMENGRWSLPQQLPDQFPQTVQQIEELERYDELDDRVRRLGSSNESLTRKQCFEIYRDKGTSMK